MNPKLIEIVAQELQRIDADWLKAEPYLSAEQILADINASGEWWVAPVEATVAMRRAANSLMTTSAAEYWDAMRTAYLSDEEKTPDAHD